MGSRYADARNLVWISGGDRSPGLADPYPDEAGPDFARGVRAGDGGRHLMTFHPSGARSSALDFHANDWLDFNIIQSGHSRRSPPNGVLIAEDRARTPVKPTLDGEPCYEDHPVEMNPEQGWFSAGDACRAAYTGFFSDACGYSYGAHGVWQFLAPGREPVSHARTTWQASLTLRGDDQLLVYLSHGKPVRLRLERPSSRARASWFDPRTGRAQDAERKPNTAEESLVTPSSDDWVLLSRGGLAAYVFGAGSTSSAPLW